MSTLRFLVVALATILLGGCHLHMHGTGHDGLDHALGGAGVGALIGLGATGSPHGAALGAGVGALAGPVLFQDRHYVPPPRHYYYDPPRRYYREYHHYHSYRPRYYRERHYYYKRWGN